MHRGWALLLCIYLLGWVPLTYAVELLTAVPSLGMRGRPAVVELAIHALVAIACAAAGWMVWVRSPAGFPLAAAAVVAGAVITIQSVFWTFLPRQIAPGDAVPVAALAVAHALFWLVMIRRS